MVIGETVVGTVLEAMIEIGFFHALGGLRYWVSLRDGMEDARDAEYGVGEDWCRAE